MSYLNDPFTSQWSVYLIAKVRKSHFFLLHTKQCATNKKTCLLALVHSWLQTCRLQVRTLPGRSCNISKPKKLRLFQLDTSWLIVYIYHMYCHKVWQFNQIKLEPHISIGTCYFCIICHIINLSPMTSNLACI